MLNGKTVLITGGAGSVGRALIPRLLSMDPDVVRIMDNNEPNLSRLTSHVGDDRLRYLVGDIRDKDRLSRAMQNVDVVIHTAALKHVELSEYNPFEAVKTNVVGLQNVVDTALDVDVEQLVFTSSDKAVNPANTMGTTKLLGEKLITAGNKYTGYSPIALSSVRFGNVVNSSESVIPLFNRQIKDGGPVTITDPEMTRFFLTYDDVADLITKALAHMDGGEVFIYKMSAINIGDLAHAMVDVIAPEHGFDPDEIEFEIVGKRLGETYHEEIMTDREASRTVENESLYAIPPETNGDMGYLNHDGLDAFTTAEDIVRNSANATLLDRDEVASLIRNSSLVGGMDGE